jgi:hypothetical protein
VKFTGLLTFMPGATDTTNGPEVAPTGMVMLMDVALQVLMVTAAPFSSTALFPWVAPNPVPESTTWLPMDPVVAEILLITGAGAEVELTETLSKTAVASEVLPLFTAKPRYTFGAMVIVWLVPRWVQFTPSAEVKLLKVFPLRLTFTHIGKVPLTVPEVEALAPVLARTPKET